LLALILISSTQAFAGSTYYRWTNDQGDTVYSDRPPPKGVEYEVVSTQSRFKRQVAAEEGAVPLETEPSVSNQFEQISTDSARRSQKNPIYCQQARENLEVLTTSDQIQMRNEQGEPHMLSPDEMEVQREIARQQIKRHCE
jgi:hypothetical protein